LCHDGRVLRIALALALILCGCSRSSDALHGKTDDAGAPAPTASSFEDAPAPPLAAPSSTLTPLDEPAPAAASAGEPSYGAPPAPAEAKRSSLARVVDDRSLAPHEAVIREHFGGTVPTPLEMQTTPLGGDRRAVLLYGPPARRKPLILVLDKNGALLWTKERPLAGTQQVVTEMVVTPGPRGEVALLWCDIPTQLVALRKWAWDGTVLADFALGEVDLCEALAGLYWPGRGWIAVASQHGAARAQLLDERGKRAFGPSGVTLPWQARPSAPVAIAVDSETSAMFFQVGDLPREGGGATPDRLLGVRLDMVGTALWQRPLDLGAAPAGAANERIQLAQRSPGDVRVTLGKTLAARVTSAGSILAR
jgi:hypothetical protein